MAPSLRQRGAKKESTGKGRISTDLHIACDNRSEIEKLNFLDYLLITLWLGWLGIVPTLLCALVLFFVYRESLTWWPFLILLVPIGGSWLYPVRLSVQPKIGFTLGEKIMKAAERYFGLRLCYMDKKAIEDAGPSIFLIEPHDVMPLGLFCFSDSLGYNTGHKNVGCLSGACFMVPLMKHVYTWASAQSVAKKNVKRLIEEDYSPTICPGGVQEVTMMREGQRECILYLKKRQGTIRLAMEYGRPIVPVFVFGQRSTWSFQILRNKFAQWAGRQIGFAPMVFFGIGGIPFAIPKPCPLTVVVGRPIKIKKHAFDKNGHLDQATVDKYHEQVLEGFTEVFEKYKDNFGMGDIELYIK